jgi:hypothetical protein
MKVNSFARITLLAGAMALAAPVFAAEPTVKEVYAAAQAGNYVEAQSMMDQVLKAHPNSASAHFVEAELLAKQGKFKAAEASLARAEQLAPGLPKVNPASVSKLRTLLAEGEKPRADYTQKQQPAGGGNNHASGGYANGASPGGGIPWGTILIFGGGLLGFIWLASRFMQRRAQQNTGGFDPAGYNPGAQQPGYPPGGYPPQGGPQQGYPQPGYGQPQGNGMGSRIMGGLATGAALGAGLVAGEAIARQFSGGSHDGGAANTDHPRNDIVYDKPDELLRRDDMGGNNFGVSGGWDDAGGGDGGDSGGGGGDWD